MNLFKARQILTTWILLDMCAAVKEETKEVCMSDEFSAECPRDHVIMMTQARYGRLQLGRCIKKDFGWLGCSVDVLPLADRRCSGRRACALGVFDAFGDLKPCTELEASLTASYTCVRVSRLHTSCGHGHHQSLDEQTPLTESTGVLASAVAAAAHCPYVLRAAPGRRWNVTLVDFATSDVAGTGDYGAVRYHSKMAASSASRGSPICQRYAVISEGRDRRVVVCGGGGSGRERTVYMSQGNLISIQLYGGGGASGRAALRDASDDPAAAAAHFLLKYEAVGCEDPPVPHGMRFVRERFTAHLTCNTSLESWVITCEDGQWLGDVGFCEEEPNWTMWSVLTREDWATPYGILIVTGLGVALGIIIGFSLLVVALYCIKRRQHYKHRHGPGYDDITAYRNQSIGSKELDYQSTMARGSTYKTRPPLPPTPTQDFRMVPHPLPPLPPTLKEATVRPLGKVLGPPPPPPCIPQEGGLCFEDDEDGNGHDAPPPPYPTTEADGSGYGTTGRLPPTYHPASHASSGCSGDHVYEVPG